MYVQHLHAVHAPDHLDAQVHMNIHEHVHVRVHDELQNVEIGD